MLVGKIKIKLETALLFFSYKITCVSILSNTSFNENEPIVCKPEHAIDCFLRTKMDNLFIEKYLIYRADN